MSAAPSLDVQVSDARLDRIRCESTRWSVDCCFFQAEDGIRDVAVTGVQTCALPISGWGRRAPAKPANEVTTDPAEAKAAGEGTDNPGEAKPANEVTTDFGQPISPPTRNRDRKSVV